MVMFILMVWIRWSCSFQWCGLDGHVHFNSGLDGHAHHFNGVD